MSVLTNRCEPSPSEVLCTKEIVDKSGEILICGLFGEQRHSFWKDMLLHFHSPPLYLRESLKPGQIKPKVSTWKVFI